MNETMLSTREAAQVAGVDIHTVRRWCRRYLLPSTETPTGYQIDRDDLERFCRENGPREIDLSTLFPGRSQRPLSPAMVARALQIEPETITHWCRTGRIPRAYKAGHYWRIPPDSRWTINRPAGLVPVDTADSR